MKAQWRETAKKKKWIHRAQNLKQLEGMILGGNEQELERTTKIIAITVDGWIWTGNTDQVETYTYNRKLIHQTALNTFETGRRSL